MIFNVLSWLGACYVFLTIGEFFYSLIHKIPPLLERRGGAAETTTKTNNNNHTNNNNNNNKIENNYQNAATSTANMSEKVEEDSSYESEIRKRRRRIAAGEIKGFINCEQKQTATGEDRKIDETNTDDGGQMIRSNNISNPNYLYGSSTTSSGDTGTTGNAQTTMVGYYDQPAGDTVTVAVRTAAPQPSPQLSFEIEHHHDQQRQRRQHLKVVNHSPALSETKKDFGLVPVKLVTTNSSSSLASGGSPFKVSENSAFRPVHRTPSLDRDTQVSNVSAESSNEPAKITIVMRNTVNSKEVHANESLTSRRYNNGENSSSFVNDSRKHSFSSSSPTVWSPDQPLAGSYNPIPLLTSKTISVIVPSPSARRKSHPIDDGKEESVIKLKSKFHDFNKTADGYSSSNVKQQQSSNGNKKDNNLFSIEKINAVPQLDNYSTLLTTTPRRNNNNSLNSNNFAQINKKFDDDDDDLTISSALPASVRSSAARIQKSSFIESTHHKPSVDLNNRQYETPSSKYYYSESPVVKKESASASAKSFEESMFQAMQPSPTLLVCRPIKKSTGSFDSASFNAEVVAKKIVAEKSRPSENLARWQAEKLEYKKIRVPLSSTSSDKDGSQYDLTQPIRDETQSSGEQALFQTSDILKAGNVTAKAKLFETIAEHEKQDIDEKSVYRRRSLRTTDKAHTMLVSPRYLAPDLYLDSSSDLHLPAASSAPKFGGNFDYYYQKSPSPLSSSDHEDEKSKMTMVEKAKLFEAKANDRYVDGTSRTSGVKTAVVDERRKTQPVTQEELAKARTVIIKSIGHSMTDQPALGLSSDVNVYAKVTAYSPKSSSSLKKEKSAKYQKLAEPVNPKPTVTVKPRKTVHLHTNGTEISSSTINEDDFSQSQERLSTKFINEQTFVNGIKNNGKCSTLGNSSQKLSTSQLVIEINGNYENGHKNGFVKKFVNHHNGTKSDLPTVETQVEKSDIVVIDQDSFNALANIPTSKYAIRNKA